MLQAADKRLPPKFCTSRIPPLKRGHFNSADFKLALQSTHLPAPLSIHEPFYLLHANKPLAHRHFLNPFTLTPYLSELSASIVSKRHKLSFSFPFILTLRLLMAYIYMEHPFLMFLDHTQRRSTVGRTPLDE